MFRLSKELQKVGARMFRPSEQVNILGSRMFRLSKDLQMFGARMFQPSKNIWKGCAWMLEDKVCLDHFQFRSIAMAFQMPERIQSHSEMRLSEMFS